MINFYSLFHSFPESESLRPPWHKKWRHFRMKFSSSRGTEQRLKTLFKFPQQFPKLILHLCLYIESSWSWTTLLILHSRGSIFYVFVLHIDIHCKWLCVWQYSFNKGWALFLSVTKEVYPFTCLAPRLLVSPSTRMPCGRGGSSY